MDIISAVDGCKGMMSSSVRIKAVVFDLDDTLISERQYIASGYRHIAEVLSVRIDVDRQSIFSILMDLFHASSKNVFNRLFEKLQIAYSEEDIMELVEAYRNHEPDIQFYYDVLPCLELLKVKGIKTGIITDGYISTQRNKMKVLNADKYFDHIIVTEELGRDYWKPHPRAYEMMHKILKVSFEEMIYIGDNPEKDFYIGSIYPIKTVMICRNNEAGSDIYKGRLYLENVKENYTIHSLVELIDLCG